MAGAGATPTRAPFSVRRVFIGACFTVALIALICMGEVNRLALSPDAPSRCVVDLVVEG